MLDQGFDALKLDSTYLYFRKTILGYVCQIYYPRDDFTVFLEQPEASLDASVKVFDVKGMLEPLPNSRTDYTFTVHVGLNDPTVSKERRWGIRKAVERGASCYIGTSRQDFEDFWNIYKRTMERAGIPARKKEHLEKVFSNHDLSKLFIVEADEEPIGAYLTIFSKEAARFYYGGFLYFCHDFHPNELGHGFIINHFQEQGLKVYDMGGAGKTPKKGDFKAGWGKYVKIYHCQLFKSWLLRRIIK
jgi:lipid II:glycine glycyltransferase (peptidoglycan interpeptide bridge formation enzyme)